MKISAYSNNITNRRINLPGADLLGELSKHGHSMVLLSINHDFFGQSGSIESDAKVNM